MSLTTVKNIDMTSVVSKMETLQNNYVKDNGEYKQIQPYTEDGFEKEVHKYKCPDDSVGYHIYFRKTVDNVN